MQRSTVLRLLGLLALAATAVAAFLFLPIKAYLADLVHLVHRPVPIFPFTLLNYALGLTRVQFHDYLLASWLGMLPGTILCVYLGSAVDDVTRLTEGRTESRPAEQTFFWVGLAVTIGVTVLVTRLARQALLRAVPETDANPQGAPHDSGAADAAR